MSTVRVRGRGWARALGAAALLLVAACHLAPPPAPLPPDPYAGSSPAPLPSAGQEIVLCGRRVPIGTRVVLWDEPTGYDAYDTRVAPGTSPEFADARTGRRYTPGRRTAKGRVLVEPYSHSQEDLARAVDLFVVHYDVCGVSSVCFDVLQRRRGLSVHFLLDVDGTLYQTLDLREQAWHASAANPRSVGVEVAQIGAYPPEERRVLDQWYARDAAGPRLTLPARLGDGGVRTPGFVARPARPERIVGPIHARALEQYDFTPQQYEALSKLAAALCRELPRIRPLAPRDAEGEVATDALSEEALARFSGILGHYHLTERKVDPGPAFDWERFLASVRARLRSAGVPVLIPLE